jgi:hypothetical protein
MMCLPVQPGGICDSNIAAMCMHRALGATHRVWCGLLAASLYTVQEHCTAALQQDDTPFRSVNLNR